MNRIIFGIILLLTLGVSHVMGQKDGQQKRDFQLGRSTETLMNLFRDANLYYVDSISPEKMVLDAARGMLSNLDPYTEYMPESVMREFEVETTGKYGGIGALIRQGRGAWIEIAEPYRGSPADKAGLRSGDRIVAIDDRELRGTSSEVVSGLLKGQPNTTFKLTIMPLSDTTIRRTLTLKREQIAIPSVSYAGFLKGTRIGYIRLEKFTDDCSSEIRTALESLSGATGIVFDLRSNGGGAVAEAVNIASLFVPRGTDIVRLKGRVKQLDATYTTKGAPMMPDTPMVVLVNSTSASASEILVGAMQDLDRAVILGQRSYGKGLVQSSRPLGDNSFLKITTAKYYTPSGRCIQALDYTHRKEDGSVGHIPDSLIRQFTTRAGRKVYDGGGIQPDVLTQPEYLSKFTAILIGYGFIDDFANEYAVRNEPRADEFALSDADYKTFCDFMSDKKIKYESATALKLKELREWAEREKFSDRLSGEFAAIEAKIKDDVQAELRNFESEIREVLAESITLRWYYSQGALERSINKDHEVIKAIEILENKTEYNKILTEQDTNKN